MVQTIQGIAGTEIKQPMKENKPKDGSEPLRDRIEKFCQLMIPSTITATEAYRQAGYSPEGAKGHSARLVAKGSVKTRIAYLRAIEAQKQGITRETQSRKLSLVAEKCFSNGEHSTYVRAVEAQNRLYGLDKQVIETKTDKPMTRTEAEEAREYAEFLLWKARQATNGSRGGDSTPKAENAAPDGRVVGIRGAG